MVFRTGNSAPSISRLKITAALSHSYPVAQFIDHDCGDKVDPGIGLSYRPARLDRLGPYDNPMP